MWAAETSPPIQLTSDTALASEGYFVLSWTSPPALQNLSLRQESVNNPADTTIRAERLPGTGSITLTGFADGEYAFQLLANAQPQSNRVAVTVQHHAMSRALGFFGLGLALFSILVASIVIGSRLTESVDAS